MSPLTAIAGVASAAAATRRSVVRSGPTALRFYEIGAQAGDAPAMFKAARLYENGEGGKQDFLRAMALYQSAAARGDAEAQNAVGLMYYLGEGVAKDLAQARQWFQAAAANGSAAAQGNLLLQGLR